MKSVFRKTIVLIVVGAAAMLLMGGADQADRGNLLKPEVFEYKFLDGNRLNNTMASDGPYCDYRRTNNSGLEWPKGTGKTSIYTAGIWMAGRHRPSGNIRTANMDYQSEYQTGPFFEGEVFNTSTNDDAAWTARDGNPRWRLYKVLISKPEGVDYGNPELNVDPWTDWPGDLGAPYVDVDGNGQWDPGTDVPEFTGDMMMWCVINDVSRPLHNSIGATPPMGLEIQILYFVFNQPGALGDMMFMRWLIMNKSDAAYDSVFMGMWCDPDLGDANDDLPGSDSVLSLGYIYNGDNDDGTTHGYGSTPPAAGFDFFQGPVVAGDPTDTARFMGRRIPGARNLGASSFVVYTNNTFAQIIDPPDGSPEYARIAYDYHLGKAGTAGTRIFYPSGHPNAGQPYPAFWFSGDPVAETGDLPSDFPLGEFAPQDIRTMINTGPFTLAAGDTQEVVGALLHAQGSDRINSVALLKQVDAIAQQAFDDDFEVPSAPPLPVVKVSELPNEIIFDWQEGSQETESYQFQNAAYDYRFEGYNLYQGESTNGPWTRIATWDLVNGVTLIEDMIQDLEAGKAYLAPVQFGTDNGLQRFFIVNQDYILGERLVNNKEYYFALTTYAYSWIPNSISLGLLTALEFAREPITVIPKGIPIDANIPTVTGEVLPHSRGLDDALIPEVIDPVQQTGATYTVAISGDTTAVTEWHVVRAGDTLATSTDFTGAVGSPLADGVQMRVINPVAGIRRDDQPSPQGYLYLPETSAWSTGASGGDTWADSAASYASGDLGAIGTGQSLVASQNLKKVEIRFGSSETSKAYRYIRGVPTFPPVPPRDPSFDQYILKKGPGAVNQGDYDAVTVPFSAYEIDSLDGNITPRRLNVGFLENNDSLYAADGSFLGRGLIDAQWGPTTAENGALEVIYVFASTYADTAGAIYSKRADQFRNLDIYYVVHLRKTDPNASWADGDRIVLTPNYVLVGGRTFDVTTVPPQSSVELASEQMGKINVVPNPYFGRNAAESNQFNRFVTFTHLPQVATIRIITITGELVRTIQHNDDTSLERWDMRNESSLPVASGVYIVHIEIPDAGTRILKLAVVQPEERSTRI